MSGDRRELPIFPLGTVLLPSMVLPLRVFESRYLAMLAEITVHDSSFGVVLIERGSEVGGGDERSGVGTLATVERTAHRADGSIDLVAVGRQRFEVERWLEDDPYPRADVVVMPPDETTAGASVDVSACDAAFVELANAAQAAGLAMEATLADLSAEPGVRLDQMAIVSPLGSYDRQRVVAAVDVAERSAVVERILRDLTLVLEAEGP